MTCAICGYDGEAEVTNVNDGYGGAILIAFCPRCEHGVEVEV